MKSVASTIRRISCRSRLGMGMNFKEPSMKFALPLTAILCIFFHSSSAAIGSARVIGMHDKESEQYKDAARTLLRAIAKGDKDAAKAAFASEGDDLKLLEVHPKLTAAFAAMAKRVDEGEFKTLDDLKKAGQATIGPIFAEYEAARKKGKLPDRPGSSKP